MDVSDCVMVETTLLKEPRAILGVIIEERTFLF